MSDRENRLKELAWTRYVAVRNSKDAMNILLDAAAELARIRMEEQRRPTAWIGGLYPNGRSLTSLS